MWADNPWLRPNNLAPDDIPGAELERLSPVVQMGEFHRDIPVLVAYKVSFFDPVTWVQERSPDADKVLSTWVP